MTISGDKRSFSSMRHTVKNVDSISSSLTSTEQTLGLERLGEYRSRVPGGDVAGGWRPASEGATA